MFAKNSRASLDVLPAAQDSRDPAYRCVLLSWGPCLLACTARLELTSVRVAASWRSSLPEGAALAQVPKGGWTRTPGARIRVRRARRQERPAPEKPPN